MIPSHWAGVFACWGLENREAALRMVTAPSAADPGSANLEVKCFDLLANPYLLLAGLLATGSAGMAAGLTLPAPIDVDPAVVSEDGLAQRGIARLPTSLSDALAAFEADDTLRDALGPALTASLVAIRRGELRLLEDIGEDEVAAATRWSH